jgi:hypothetical protein
MKKLPKRDGYKPKPLPRMPTMEEILKENAAYELCRLAEENGIDVREFLRSLRARKRKSASAKLRSA